jgi:hypothetical protein
VNEKKIIYFENDIAEYYTEFNNSDAGFGKTTKIKLQFIEGIGITYAMNSNGEYRGYDATGKITFMGPHSHFLLCKYMDDTLSFMTNPILGCFQEGNPNAAHVDVNQNKLRTIINCYVENDILNVSFPENTNLQQGELKIIDLLGCIRYNKRINNNPEHIHISNLCSGVYVLLYADKNNKLLTKFVKTE